MIEMAIFFTIILDYIIVNLLPKNKTITFIFLLTINTAMYCLLYQFDITSLDLKLGIWTVFLWIGISLFFVFLFNFDCFSMITVFFFLVFSPVSHESLGTLIFLSIAIFYKKNISIAKLGIAFAINICALNFLGFSTLIEGSQIVEVTNFQIYSYFFILYFLAYHIIVLEFLNDQLKNSSRLMLVPIIILFIGLLSHFSNFVSLNLQDIISDYMYLSLYGLLLKVVFDIYKGQRNTSPISLWLFLQLCFLQPSLDSLPFLLCVVGLVATTLFDKVFGKDNFILTFLRCLTIFLVFYLSQDKYSNINMLAVLIIDTAATYRAKRRNVIIEGL